MALAACLSHAQIFLHSDTLCNVVRNQRKLMLDTRLNVFSFQRLSTQQLSHGGGFRNTTRPNIDRLCLSKKRLRLEICPCLSQVASSAFTLGTAAVLPFYTLMVFAPKSEITKKAMESSIPYLVLGLVYAYLLYLSWTPETIRLMFSSQYWLPELAGIAKMFSSEMTLASAWIHLLVVDLFAARCIYQDGLANKIETRHSVSLCLLVCPIGIFMHTITKALTTTQVGTTKHNT